MNPEEMKKWMKEKYAELDDFDNLQFVKDCAEDGVRKYKEKVKEVSEKWKSGLEHIGLDLKKELELE